MTNTLLIGKLIYGTISSSAEVTSLVDNRIYPIVAPAETTYPFIVYTRANAYPNTHTKDGWVGDNASFQITIVSDKYFESADIANNVRDLFENCRISNEELSIENIRMTSASEAFSEDAYTQTLYFDCEAN